MKFFGLLGYPVRHSFSPVLMNTLAHQEGWDLVYAGLNVPPQKLSTFFQLAAELPIHGLNVTAPHKRSVLNYCVRVSETVSHICAANVLVLQGGKYVAENTDVPGFLYGLRLLLGAEEIKEALVLGAGGAARAAVLGLFRAGVKEIFVASRSVQRAGEWQRDCPTLLDMGKLSFVVLEKGLLEDLLPGMQLVVQTTPVGTWPDVEESLDVPLERLPVGAFVYDLVYNPVETTFLKRAKRCGARVLGGLPMLAAQAVEALRIWGYEIPVERALSVLQDFLNTRRKGGEQAC